MIPQLLSYYWRCLRNDRFRNFFSEGLGIEARFGRARSFWEPHLNLSKQFQSDCIARHLPEWRSIAIFGAGRLLDVPEKFLCEHSGKKIVLIDADPGCLRAWNLFKTGASAGGIDVDFFQTDITGKFSAWSDALITSIHTQKLAKKDQAKAAELVENLTTLKLQPSELPRTEIMVSLNILGQLSVYWRQRLKGILSRHGINTDEKLDARLEAAITKTCTQLEQEHLRQLLEHDPKLVIMLSDDEYYYYKKDLAQWQVESALHSEVPVQLENYRRVATDSWLWHIAPQGIEDKDYGEIHRVKACAFLRKDSSISKTSH